MPGCWELKEQRKVLCAFLHTELTSVAWAVGFRNLIIPGEIYPISGMTYDHGRNAACEAALRGGFSWLFFLDSDVIPPRDAILRLMAHGKPWISGVYHRRSPPHGLPVAIKNGSWLNYVPPNTLLEVDLVGAGCLLIHRTLLERCPPQRPEAGKHWFDWRVDMQNVPNYPRDMALSEDFTLCRHLKKTLGVPTLLDTSVQCRHVGLAQATFGNLAPCEVMTAA